MSQIKPLITVIRAGRLSYSAGLQLQDHLSRQSVEQVEQFRNVLLLLEHEPVYTIGIRTKGYTEVEEQRLRQLGAEFHRTNRGGLITFHGPGQLVAYPIIHLKHFKPSMRWYVSMLERTIIDVCFHLGIKVAKTTEDTGIWVGNNKICAIGVHGSRYVTTHGIGLNCNTDLSWFEHIVPCGIEGKGVTSLSKELQRDVTIEEASKVFIRSFSKVFQCDVVQEQNAQTLKKHQ